MAKIIWDYIREACEQCNISIPSDGLPFTNNQDVKSSIIDAEGRNRILLFPGAFNPAHEGHLQLLQSVLNDMKKHLDIRGVVIFPHGDEQIRDKTREEPADLGLDKTKRSALWRNAAGFPADNAWIFTESRSALTRFQKQLQGNLRKENVNLTFLLLVGSDWISTRAVYDPGQWNCSETITSDVSRPVDFRCEYTLRQIPGCFDWVQMVFAESTTYFPWDSFQTPYGRKLCGFLLSWASIKERALADLSFKLTWWKASVYGPHRQSAHRFGDTTWCLACVHVLPVRRVQALRVSVKGYSRPVPNASP